MRILGGCHNKEKDSKEKSRDTWHASFAHQATRSKVLRNENEPEGLKKLELDVAVASLSNAGEKKFKEPLSYLISRIAPNGLQCRCFYGSQQLPLDISDSFSCVEYNSRGKCLVMIQSPFSFYRSASHNHARSRNCPMGAVLILGHC